MDADHHEPPPPGQPSPSPERLPGPVRGGESPPAPSGEPGPSALDVERRDDTEVVRARWAMDGATTLGEAAAMLRAMASDLEAWEAAGWQLTDPVEDGYGFVRRSG